MHHCKTLWTVLDNFAAFCIILKYLVRFLILLDHFGPFNHFWSNFVVFWAYTLVFWPNTMEFGQIRWYVLSNSVVFFFGKYSGILGKFKWTYFWIGLVTTFKTWHDFVMLSIHKKEDNLTFVGYFHIIQLCKQIMNQTK